MAGGGSKPGERRGGRKKGSLTVRTQQIAAALQKNPDDAPLAVLLKHMKFYDEKAEAETRALFRLTEYLLEHPKDEETTKAIHQLIKVIQAMTNSRVMACDFASRAAIYIHPRPAPVAAAPDRQAEIFEQITRDTPAVEAAMFYRNYLTAGD
jgi:hypothetical protein